MPDTTTGRPSRPLTVAQVALRLGCSAKTVRRLLDERKLRGFKLEHEWRVSPEALVEYMTRSEVE